MWLFDFIRRAFYKTFGHRNAYERTRNLLTEHREDVIKVASLLLEKEVITRYVTYLIGKLFIYIP